MKARDHVRGAAPHLADAFGQDIVVSDTAAGSAHGYSV